MVALSVFLTSAASQGAQALRVDLGAELRAARKAWRDGEALGAKARVALLSEKGGGQDALKLLDAQDRLYRRAEKAFRAALKRAPKHPHALAEFGTFLARRRRFVEADRMLSAALESPRAKTAFEPAERADVARTLGGVQERAGRREAALARYRQALALSPEDPRNRLSLAVSLCAWGRAQEAADLLKPWSEASGPGHSAPPALKALGRYTLAYAQEEEGFAEEALENYQRAQKIAAQAGAADEAGVREQAEGAARRLARLARRFEKKEGARKAFTRAYALCDEGVRLKRQALKERAVFIQARRRLWQAPTEKAKAAARGAEPLQTLDAAMERFRDALRSYAHCGKAHYEWALCQMALVDLKSARQHLDAAALYDPLSPAVLALQGEVHLMLGDWSGARAVFTKLREVEPDYGPAHLGWARAEVKLSRNQKDLDAALDALDRAQRLGADAEFIASVHAAVRKRMLRVMRGGKLTPAPSGRPRNDAEQRRRKLEKEILSGSVLEE